MTHLWPIGPALARIIPFALFILVLALEGAFTGIDTDFDARWLYPVKTLLVAGATWLLWRHYSELAKFDLPFRSVLVAVAVGVLIFVLWINLDFGWLVVGGSGAGYDPRDAQGNYIWALVFFRLAGAALLVPLIEELFWRSFLQRWIQQQDFMAVDPALVGFRALFFASIVFAVEHTLWFAGLLAGLAYGWLYITTRSLWSPIIAHAVTNGLLGGYVLWTQSWRFW